MFRRTYLAASLTIAGFTVGIALAQPATTRVAKPKTNHQNYTEHLVGSDGSKVNFDMVAVPGGEFVMGSPSTEVGRGKDEGPQVKVRLKPFWIGKCEVTWDEYDLYFRLNNDSLKDGAAEGVEKKDGEEKKEPSATDGKQDVRKDGEPKKGEPKKDAKEAPKPKTPADAVSKPTKPYVDETYGHERDKKPAICMTHHAAMKYCEWLTKTTGKPYRLLTEAEWEYACRAGTTTPHALPAGGKLDDYAWYAANSQPPEGARKTTHEVATKKPNAWGIHDMHGNVMEWCLDHHLADAYTRFNKLALVDGFVLSPVIKPTENKWAHVARGGHFKDEAKDIRSAARRRSDRKWMKADPQEPQSIWWLTNYDQVGFRVCRPVEDDDLKNIVSKVVRLNDDTYEGE